MMYVAGIRGLLPYVDLLLNDVCIVLYWTVENVIIVVIICIESEGTYWYLINVQTIRKSFYYKNCIFTIIQKGLLSAITQLLYILFAICN